MRTFHLIWQTLLVAAIIAVAFLGIPYLIQLALGTR